MREGWCTPHSFPQFQECFYIKVGSHWGDGVVIEVLEHIIRSFSIIFMYYFHYSTCNFENDKIAIEWLFFFAEWHLSIMNKFHCYTQVPLSHIQTLKLALNVTYLLLELTFTLWLNEPFKSSVKIYRKLRSPGRILATTTWNWFYLRWKIPNV